MKTKTNLHVGSDSLNYDIVDKTVQRDTITTLPVINASSLKGAMRYHFSQIQDEFSDELMGQIFGNEGGSNNGKEGDIKFLDSYLLFLPLRSNKKPFYHVASKDNLLAFISFYEELNGGSEKLDNAKSVIDQLSDNIVLNEDESQIEDHICKRFDLNLDDLLDLFPDNIKPKNIAIFSNENFIDAVTHLPVIARNKVQTEKEKGNLWYEEIVPRESIFYTANLDYANYGSHRKTSATKTYDNFYEKLQNGYIQIGANASIGFGLCSFSLINIDDQEKKDA